MNGINLHESNDFYWPVEIAGKETDLSAIVVPAVESFSRSLDVDFSLNGKSYFCDDEGKEFEGIPCLAVCSNRDDDNDIEWGQYDFFAVTPLEKIFTDELDMIIDNDMDDLDGYRAELIETLESLIDKIKNYRK